MRDEFARAGHIGLQKIAIVIVIDVSVVKLLPVSKDVYVLSVFGNSFLAYQRKDQVRFDRSWQARGELRGGKPTIEHELVVGQVDVIGRRNDALLPAGLRAPHHVIFLKKERKHRVQMGLTDGLGVKFDVNEVEPAPIRKIQDGSAPIGLIAKQNRWFGPDH